MGTPSVGVGGGLCDSPRDLDHPARSRATGSRAVPAATSCTRRRSATAASRSGSASAAPTPRSVVRSRRRVDDQGRVAVAGRRLRADHDAPRPDGRPAAARRSGRSEAASRRGETHISSEFDRLRRRIGRRTAKSPLSTSFASSRSSACEPHETARRTQRSTPPGHVGTAVWWGQMLTAPTPNAWRAGLTSPVRGDALAPLGRDNQRCKPLVGRG